MYVDRVLQAGAATRSAVAGLDANTAFGGAMVYQRAVGNVLNCFQKYVLFLSLKEG